MFLKEVHDCLCFYHLTWHMVMMARGRVQYSVRVQYCYDLQIFGTCYFIQAYLSPGDIYKHQQISSAD